MSRTVRWIATALVLALLVPSAGQALPLGKARSAGPEPMNFLEAAWTWITDRLMPEPHVLWEAAAGGWTPTAPIPTIPTAPTTLTRAEPWTPTASSSVRAPVPATGALFSRIRLSRFPGFEYSML